MKTYVSLLRGVNVGGKQMKMEDLRSLCLSMGLMGVRSYVQSGNVVFVDERDARQLEEGMEKKIRDRFHLDVPVFIRTREELRAIVEGNPLVKRDGTKLHVTFLASPPVDPRVEEIARAKSAEEEFACSGREVYLFCPNGYGRTKLSNAFLEKKLGVPATTRNWRTVKTLLRMSETS